MRLLPGLAARLGATLVVLFVAAPLWYMLVLSLDPDPVGGAAGMIPQRISLDNFRILTSDVFGFYPALRHSLLLSVVTTAVSLLLAIPAAYALGRLHVRGQEWILALMLALAFFPGIVLAAPLAKVFADIGWLDHLAPIGLAQLSFTVPLSIWLLTYAFRAVPQEVEDAALMDGARTFQRIVKVILPTAKAGVGGTLALVFVASWNDFLFASTLNRSRRSETLPVMVAGLPELGFLGGQMAAAVLTCAPVVLVVAALLSWLSRRNDGRRA